MDLIFRTSEYNFKPIKCLVFGSGILEIPAELPVKQILNPITPKHKKQTTGNKLPTSPPIKKDEKMAPDEPQIIVASLENEPARKDSVMDMFTAELESNVSQRQRYRSQTNLLLLSFTRLLS